MCQNVLETGESVTLGVMIWSEEWIDKGRSDLVQQMLGLCVQRMGPEIDD